ncbi:hypothetical protein M405DRAFT_560387 [Rhizopogon salebrosus TDB-379]|nr:hypothetical protein M405DRAFT_560387 [Rhizopogon salebrosus TDB-379]
MGHGAQTDSLLFRTRLEIPLKSCLPRGWYDSCLTPSTNFCLFGSESLPSFLHLSAVLVSVIAGGIMDWSTHRVQ